jgi:S-formylglutathione hydrolase
MTSKLIDAALKSDLVPRDVEYSVIIPDGHENKKALPLVLNLHGGRGSRERLKTQKVLWDRLWADERIPPMVVAMPSVRRRCFYMDFKDGSEKWETFITDPFLKHLRDTSPVTDDPKRTFLMGASMGGMGSLRMAFRYPDKFGAVAALEPGIEPILKWEEMRPKHRFWREEELFERTCGKPVDPE